MSVTNQYSFRLWRNYTAPLDWKGAFERARGRISVVVGADDQLMDAHAYERALSPFGVPVTIVSGADHMGIVYRPEAVNAILTEFTR
jgi:pimeloyl-ACP methyl ester carboxylesterase